LDLSLSCKGHSLQEIEPPLHNFGILAYKGANIPTTLLSPFELERSFLNFVNN
jgi:hypothetical protein